MTDAGDATGNPSRAAAVGDLAPPLRRPRSRVHRLRVALRHEPKRLLYPLLGLGTGGRRPPDPADLGRARRVLVLREMNTLGDALLATPAVRALADAHPHLEVGLVTGWRNAAVWRHSPRLARLFVLERGSKPARFAVLVRSIRRWRPDVAVTLESVTCHATLDVLARASGAPLRVRYDGAAFRRPHTNAAYTALVPLSAAAGPHQIELVAGVLRPFGVELADRRLELVPGRQAETDAERLLRRHRATEARFALLHPGSKQVHNRWPLERFLVVRERLAARHLRVLVSFGPSEEPARAWFAERGVPPDDLLSPMSLEVLAAVLRRAAVAVVPDTGILHVAAAVGAPVVGLYGSGDPRLWQPPGAVRAVSDHARGNVGGIPVEAVLAALDAVLEGRVSAEG